MDNKDKEVTLENIQEDMVEDLQIENENVNIDPTKEDKTPEPVSAKKTYRITQSNKDLAETLESELNTSTGNEFFGLLLKTFIDTQNMETDVYRQNDRYELVECLKTVVEIFDRQEKKHEMKRNSYMSRNTDKINELSKEIEELKTQIETITKESKKEIDTINDKYVVETSQLNLKVKKYEEEIYNKQKTNEKLEEDLERLKKDLKDTEAKLTDSIKEQSNVINSIKEKDKIINELSEENRELNKKVINNVQEVSNLERENRELAAQVSNLTDKIETTVAFQTQQKELYEEQIKAYKEMISNKK